MQSTYETAITEVFKDEGGYTNDPHDPGGPTNWGITIEDARMYWKADATAEDVRTMPRSVAEEIYEKHYAAPILYGELPAGVDYSVLDYGINSGNSRSVKTLQGIVGVHQDGVVGPLTITATNQHNANEVIDEIYAQRLTFLHGLANWSRYGNGWGSRCNRGRTLAHQLANSYNGSTKAIPPTVPVTPTKPVTKQPVTFWQALLALILTIFKRT